MMSPLKTRLKPPPTSVLVSTRFRASNSSNKSLSFVNKSFKLCEESKIGGNNIECAIEYRRRWN